MRRRALRRAVLRAGVSAAVAAVAARVLGRRDLAGLAASAAAAAGAAQEHLPSVAPGVLAVGVLGGARRPGPAPLAGAVGGGALAAVVVRSIWPVAPDDAAEVRALRQVDLAPSPRGDGIVIAVNASAGTAGGGLAEDLAAALPGARIVPLEDPGDLVPVLSDAAANGATALGVVGGDGTINAAAAVAAEHGLPLVAVPGGTLNHLARDLGVTGVDDVVAAITAGTAIEVDLPTIDGRRFVNTASFGSYAELVDAREALEEQIGKWPAMVVALVRVLRRGEPVRVHLDGRDRSLWMVFIGNCRYRPDGFAPTWRERLDDGVLDVRIVDATRPMCRTRLVLALLTGQLGRTAVYDRWRTTQVVVRSADGPLRLACDGETFDSDGDEVVIAKDGKRLAIYAPR